MPSDIPASVPVIALSLLAAVLAAGLVRLAWLARQGERSPRLFVSAAVMLALVLVVIAVRAPVL